MKLIKRSHGKRDHARKVVAKKTKSAKKSAKRLGIKKAFQKFVPKKALVAIGGAAAAVAGVFAIKKRKGSDPVPAYTPPTPPSPAPTPPPAASTADSPPSPPSE